MIIGPPRKLAETYETSIRPLMISTTILQRVNSYVYLGINIDETLSFRKALTSVYGQTSNKMYLLSLMRKYLNEKAAIRIFKSMVLPYMEYVFFCLNPCTDKDITKLQRLQNRGLRICYKSTVRTSVLQLHKSAKLLLVRNKIKLNTLKQMYRFIKRESCNYCKTLQNVDRVTRANLGPMFVNIFPNSTRFQKSLCGHGFSLWNQLPVDIRKIDDKDAFTAELKRRLHLEQDRDINLPNYMKRA